MAENDPPLALVTGVSREVGIGHSIARRLVDDGWRVVAAGWRDYDDRMPWGADARPLVFGVPSIDVDLADPAASEALVTTVNAAHGPIRALVMCHCESVDGDIVTTTIERFDRHMAVNARATWLLIQAYAAQFDEDPGSGRIVAITSDHTAGNLAYGASKGAMDRIVIAAAHELAHRGITANVVNPGATDTGWMTPEIERQVLADNLQARLGRPEDVANLVGFLCSPEGQWINGQLLYSDGGRR